jgi:LPS-assembly protein
LRAFGVLLLGLLMADALTARPASAQAPPATTVVAAGETITVLAERLEEIGRDLVVATGRVEVVRGRQRLTADRVELNRQTGDVVAVGRALLYDGEDRLAGDRIEFNVRTGTGVVYEGRAHAPPYYRLQGERMERLGQARYRVEGGRLTTCEDEPPTWSVRFRRADADLEEFVWGTGASFWVKDVPLIPFVPWFAAPLRRERQTGFLLPRVGDSSRKGPFLELPFFWAISDSQDLTLALDGYAERGLGLTADWRLLLSRDHRARVGGFYLWEGERPARERVGFGEHRGWWDVDHRWTPGGGWSLRADIHGGREYADRLHDRGAQRVESNVFVQRSWPAWTLVGNLFWYQDLTQRRPVELQRLPELRLEGIRQPVPGLPGTLWELESSATHFVRDVGADGNRLDLHPRLSRPLSLLGAVTLTPFAGGRFTGYDRTATGTRVTREGGLTVQTTDDDPRVRALWEAGFDLELRASRVFELGGWGGLDAVMHTLEPRVTYTRRDGTELVRFRGDGTLRPNRLPQFDGIDALAESSAVTYSLTNRLQARSVAPPGTEPARWEYARFTLGHSWEFLNPARPAGPVTADLIVNPHHLLTFRGTTSYGVYDQGFVAGTTDLTLDVAPVRASVGTRFSKPDRVHFLQSTLSAALTRWLAGRLETQWDLRRDVFVENRVSLDFTWQCWALTLQYIARHRNEDEVRFAVNLLGVGGALTTGVRPGALGLGGER